MLFTSLVQKWKSCLLRFHVKQPVWIFHPSWCFFSHFLVPRLWRTLRAQSSRYGRALCDSSANSSISPSNSVHRYPRHSRLSHCSNTEHLSFSHWTSHSQCSCSPHFYIRWVKHCCGFLKYMLTSFNCHFCWLWQRLKNCSSRALMPCFVVQFLLRRLPPDNTCHLFPQVSTQHLGVCCVWSCAISYRRPWNWPPLGSVADGAVAPLRMSSSPPGSLSDTASKAMSPSFASPVSPSTGNHEVDDLLSFILLLILLHCGANSSQNVLSEMSPVKESPLPRPVADIPRELPRSFAPSFFTCWYPPCSPVFSD